MTQSILSYGLRWLAHSWSLALLYLQLLTWGLVSAVNQYWVGVVSEIKGLPKAKRRPGGFLTGRRWLGELPQPGNPDSGRASHLDGIGRVR